MEATNRRQLPNVPKKPVRQSSSSRDNREPTPDYDSTGDKGIKIVKTANSRKKKHTDWHQNATKVVFNFVQSER